MAEPDLDFDLDGDEEMSERLEAACNLHEILQEKYLEMEEADGDIEIDITVDLGKAITALQDIVKTTDHMDPEEKRQILHYLVNCMYNGFSIAKDRHPHLVALPIDLILTILDQSRDDGDLLADCMLTLDVFAEYHPTHVVAVLPRIVTAFIAVLNSDASSESPFTMSTVLDVIGALPTKLEEHMVPYTESFMAEFLKLMDRQPPLETRSRSSLIIIIGTFAMAAPAQTVPFLNPLFAYLHTASSTAFPDASDDEACDEFEGLQSALAETFTAFLQGFKEDAAHVSHFVDPIIFWLQRLTSGESGVELSEDLLHKALGLVGDLMDVFKVQVKTKLDGLPLNELVQRALECDEKKLKTIANWVSGLMTQIGLQ